MLGQENPPVNLPGSNLVASGVKKFDIVKSGVFWFAAGYAVALYMGRKKKIAS